MGKYKCSVNGCKNKLNLHHTLITCKCNLFFCDDHRDSMKHNCTYNYQSEHKKILEETLVKCMRDKVPII